MPVRSKKNAQHILEKMLNSQDTATWREMGEFVFNGIVIPGTHIFDLVRSATAPQTTRRRRISECYSKIKYTAFHSSK